MSKFDKVIERRNTLSIKWHDIEKKFNNDDCIPMWIADSDFEPPQEVIDAFKREIDHGIFGYSYYPNTLLESIQSWIYRRHQVEANINDIFLNNAVLPTISMVIKELTAEGDGVLMHTPVYHPFFLIAKEVGRKAIFSELILKDNKYITDLENFEKTIIENNIKLFLLSNPHNPGGKAWSKEELIDIETICKKHNVIILSDEIHSDLTMPHIKHIPAVVAAPEYEQNIITVMAPTKTFNLAGVKSSFYITKNNEFKKLFLKAQKYISTPELNNFAIVGTEAAYKYGDKWVDELRDYIYQNYKYTKEILEERYPQISVLEHEATYLLWISFKAIDKSEGEIFNALSNAGIGLNKGSQYGVEGEKYFRMNIGCPRETLEIAINRLLKGIDNILSN